MTIQPNGRRTNFDNDSKGDTKERGKAEPSNEGIQHIMAFLAVLLSLLLVFQPLVSESRPTRVTWVNGIAYHLDHMQQGQEFISRLFGREKVYYCYNPTKQSHDQDTYGYLSDLTQAGTQKLGVITQEVHVLVEFLQQAIAAVGPRGVVVHIAHSQGALITALAAKQLTVQEMSQMEVLTFGGAAAIRQTMATPFRRCVNYYSVNDPLLLVVPQAAAALRAGLVSDEEFVFLMPRLGDPIRDHNLIGDTYAQALQWEGQRFQQQHRSILHRHLQPALVGGITTMTVAGKRLDAWLQSILKQVMKWMLMCYQACKRQGGIWHDKLQNQVLRPLLAMLVLIVEWILEKKRSVTGEDKYEPLSTATTTTTTQQFDAPNVEADNGSSQ